MAVSKSTVNSRIAEALGMSDGGSALGTYNGLTYKSADVDLSILAADALVCSGYIQSVGNGQRRPFESAVSVAHGALITAHTGPIGAVTFTVTGGLYAGTRAGRLASKEEVERDNLNPTPALKTIPPKYAIEGDRLYHNGEALVKGGASAVAVTVDLCTFAKTSACQAPDEAEDAVFHGAMFLVAKNGNHHDAAGSYRQTFQGDLMLLGVAPQLAAQMSSGLDERAQGTQA